MIDNNKATNGDIIHVDDLKLNLKTSTVITSSKQVDLTPTETQILAVLMRNADAIVSRELLYEKVWTNSQLIDEGRALNVHIHMLRRKLEKNPRQPELIITRHGLGYTLNI